MRLKHKENPRKEAIYAAMDRFYKGDIARVNSFVAARSRAG